MLPKSFNHAMSLCISLTLLFGVSSGVQAKSSITGDLPRRADLGFRFSSEDQLVVTGINEGSVAAESGVQKGDVLLSVNGKRLSNDLGAATVLQRAIGGVQLRLRIDRSGKQHDLAFSPPPKELEAIPDVDSEYGVVDISDSVRLRSIVSYPSGTKKSLPTVFFVQWVSCGSLEFNPKSTSGRVQANLIKKADRTLIRVERSASGDSQGPACHELDYDTELEHYYRAFLTLRQHPKVDPNNIVIYGSSLGSTIAPLLAEKLLDKGLNIAGVMVQGGGTLTYFERMLNFERIFLERQKNAEGKHFKPAEIHSKFLKRSVFFTEYLINGRHPDLVAKDSKDMKAVRRSIRGLSDREHYGRPFSWHQQAAKHNFLKAWHSINAPVLVVYNEFDQFETRHGHKMIVDMVNRWRPGSATFIEQKNMGHSNYYYSSAENAYNDVDGKSNPEPFSRHLIEWLNTHR